MAVPGVDELLQIVERRIEAFFERRNSARIQHMARDGTHVDHSVGEAQRGYFVDVVFNGVGIAEAMEIGFAVNPHKRLLVVGGTGSEAASDYGEQCYDEMLDTCHKG